MPARYRYNEEALENLRITDPSLLDRLIDHDASREYHLKKSRGKHDKRMSLREAVAEFVKDGDIYAETGFGYVRQPLQVLIELVRQEKKDLQFIGTPSNGASLMAAAGVCRYAHTSYVGLEMRGTDRTWAKNVKSGKVKIISEWSHGSLGMAFKAAQYGAPYIATKMLLGTDMMKYNPYVYEMKDPYNGEPVAVVPAVHPDVTFVHCQQADMYGNGKIFGPTVNDLAIAGASRKVIVTCEEVVPHTAIRYNPSDTVIPFYMVDAVVELPWGCLPGCCPGYYYWFREWWEWNLRVAARSDEAMEEFIDYWFRDTRDQYDFIDKMNACMGGSRYLDQLRRLERAEEYLIEDSGVDFSYQQVWAAPEKAD